MLQNVRGKKICECKTSCLTPDKLVIAVDFTNTLLILKHFRNTLWFLVFVCINQPSSSGVKNHSFAGYLHKNFFLSQHTAAAMDGRILFLCFYLFQIENTHPQGLRINVIGRFYNTNISILYYKQFPELWVIAHCYRISKGN